MSRTLILSCFALAASLAPLTAAPAQFETPKGWVAEATKSKMRSHQWRIPKAEGQSRGAEVIVYYFGPQGGGTYESNLARWQKQVVKGEGDREPTKKELTCGGFPTKIYDQVGTYTAPQFRPGAPKATPQPGTRMINAVVVTPEGRYFVRLIGPAQVVAKHEAAFMKMLEGIRLGETPLPNPPADPPASQPAR